MGFINKLYQPVGPEQRSYGNVSDYWYQTVPLTTEAGVDVSTDNAMRCLTIYSCIRILCESISSLPLILYRRKDRGKERATDHHLYHLLHSSPWPNVTAASWLDVMVLHAALTGNHYSEALRNNRGQIVGLLPWNPNTTSTHFTKDGKLFYELKQQDGSPRRVLAENMVHVAPFTFDGLNGLSPISYAREGIGLALAGERFGGKFFSQGAHPGLVVTNPVNAQYSDEDWDRLRQGINENYAGLGNAYKALVLTGGMEAKQVGIPPQDAQYIESRRYQKAELASIYRIPLHMIQEVSGSTSWGSGIQEMNIGFIVHTLRPWLVKIEQVLTMKLLSPAEQEDYFVEFLVDGLLRGDAKSRAEYYDSMIRNKVMTPNEVREKENMNPVAWGDEPVQMENIHGKAEEPPKTEQKSEAHCDCGHDHGPVEARNVVPLAEIRAAKIRQNTQRSFEKVIADGIDRVLKRERRDVVDGVKKELNKKGVSDVIAFLDDYYSRHMEFLLTVIRPALEGLAEAIGPQALAEIGAEFENNERMRTWVDGYVTRFAEGYSASNLTQLTQLVNEGGDIVQAIEGRFDEWMLPASEGALTRAQKLGAAETKKLGQKFSRHVWMENGVTQLRWVNTGSETCPYCRSLNNKIVGIQESFIGEGEDFQPEGATEPLKPSRNVYTPPCHGGCDCVIVPVTSS